MTYQDHDPYRGQKAMDMEYITRPERRTSAINNLAVWLLFSEVTKYTVFYEQISWTELLYGKRTYLLTTVLIRTSIIQKDAP